MKATVVFVVVWLLVLLALAYGEPLIACAEQHPGEVRPKDWSYRTIDQKRCWYRGPQMMRKDKLYWPMPEPDWMRNREEPETVLPQEEAAAPWVLEHRWPIYGRGE